MIRFEVDIYHLPNGAGFELDRLMKGPDVARMEAALLAGFATSEGRVHVITGALKASMHPSSSLGAGDWEGTMSAARYPGIFELARGNRPSKYHPGGGHYFFGPGGQDFEREVRETVWEWISGGHAPAPSQGLGWKSGGDD
jgi:hypothetical protein